MPTFDPRPFTNPNNVDILNAVRAGATLDYQRRIPAATKANIQETIDNLLNYKPQMNEFVDALVNRIGLEIVKYNTWTNPLAKFKRGMLDFGDTIEEINVGLIKAKVYDPDRQSLEQDIFGVEKPDVQSSFHKVNRQNYYKLSINESLLKRAFLAEFGLSKFITALMSTPTTSDNWDEFLLTTGLFAEYYRAGGFFKSHVPDLGAVDSDSADAKYGLRRIREFAGNLAFPSTYYNASGMPVAATPDELELFITPEANAALDVEALAGAFNIDKAEVPSRTTVIPKEYFGIDGAQAVLTTRDFFVIADQKIETTTAINPVGLHTNYFLHRWQVVSASRFVPAVLFTTEESDEIITVQTPVQSINAPVVKDAAGTTVTSVTRGGLYNVQTYAVTSPVNGANDAVRMELVGAVSPRSYISQTGMLHVSVDEEATSLTVNIFAVDSGEGLDDQITTALVLPVIGALVNLWPNAGVAEDTDNDGLLERTPEPLTMDAQFNVTIPSVEGVQYKKAGVNVNNGTVHAITGTVAFTAVARAGSELATGAPASWSFTH